MRLTFCGANREVTGSNILLEIEKKRILLDCGIFQGYRLAEERNYSPFPYDPKTIDFVVVGHAHLDHTGRIPKLVKDGFRGKILATSATKELVRLVLDDSEKLISEEAQRNNHLPLFESDDVQKSMELFETLNYGETIEISSGLKLTLKNAGHILGSSLTVIEAEGLTLIYTSDIGNNPSILLDPPEYLERADFLICESTYGGRIHENANLRIGKLSQIISATIAKNGVLMIPTFAVERTQELLYDVERVCTIQNCEKPTFYLDSPLAQKVTKVFEKYPDFLNKELRSEGKVEEFLGLDRLKITTSVEESKTINTSPNPKVIIAGSGMMNGGRILHHIRRYIGNANNTLLIVGYQATGTMGRRILDGAEEISIFGEKLTVGANIRAIGSYSAHADLPQLTNWVSKIKSLKRVFIVHGENDQSLTLAKNILEKLNVPAVIPQTGESFEY